MGVTVTPYKQRVKGIGGCVIAPGNTTYRLANGSRTQAVVVPRSLVFAEPSLRQLIEAPVLTWEEARELGYRAVRSYEEAVAYGLA